MSQTTTTNYAQVTEKAVQTYLQTVQSSKFTEVLQANTDRIQGSLVLVGYELEGGTDNEMIQRAALAIELFHAYVQCMDKGIATDQALRAAHEAGVILANLDVDPEYRLKAVSITNRTMMLVATARDKKASEKDVMYWRATELALNPLHVGQVLAGAECDRTNAVTPVALAYGESLLQAKAENFDECIARLRAFV